MKNLFFQKVYDIVAKIPSGKVVTYGQIAAYLGNPRNARMVGWAMHSSPSGLSWYRVVMKSGKLPFEGITFDSTSQREMLEKEKVTFTNDGCVDLEKHLWQIDVSL